MRVRSGKLEGPKRNIKVYDNSEPLTNEEMEVADLIAEEIKLDEDSPGLIIWKRCREYRVDQTKIARHLNKRARSKEV